jgi:osmotically-inducible protein OsmY
MTGRTVQPPIRPDAEILADARLALDCRADVPPTVLVHVQHGVAWLTGTVQRDLMRADAEDAVRRVPGVRRVVNDVTVSVPADHSPAS